MTSSQMFQYLNIKFYGEWPKSIQPSVDNKEFADQICSNDQQPAA